MIDRRSFLAKSSVAAALAAVGIQPEGASAAPLALPATITPARVESLTPEVVEDPGPIHRFSGAWTTLDRYNNVILFNEMEIWATSRQCGFVVSGGAAGVSEKASHSMTSRSLGL